MRTRKIVILGFVIVTSLTKSLGQQDPHFTQYFDNMLFVNPAYAGSNGMLNVTSIHREQWVGFDGRPRSTTLSLHSPLAYESVGLGFTMVNDEIGPFNQTMFYGDFSYTLKFKKKPGHMLSFGLKGGFNLINMNTSALIASDDNDPNVLQDVRNNINPNFGFGIYYHTPGFFIGVSTPKMLENSYDGFSPTHLERRHYFGIIGGIISLNNTWKLRPTAQIKITENAPISVDLSTAFIYREKLWMGAMYRLESAFGAFVQYQLSTQFRLGLASDFGTTAIRNYNYGTFEIMLAYDFVFKKDGIRSPRYF
jgi:type IX secretion system PorP/SprF family membrane protein